MNQLSTHKRINFQLDRDLALAFESRAFKAGITKSKLLLDWIYNADFDLRRKIKTKADPMNYNLRVPVGLYDKIIHYAEKLKLTKSAVLRMVIYENVEVDLIGEIQTTKFYNLRLGNLSFRDLWLSGRLGELLGKGLSDFDSLDIGNKLLIAETQANLGLIDQCGKTLEIITDNNKGKRGHINLKKLIIRIDMKIFQTDIEGVEEEIVSGIKIAKYMGDTLSIGKLYYLLGVVSYLSDNFNDAFKYHIESLNYLDIINSPIEIAQTYLRLSTLFRLVLNEKKSEVFSDRAKGIFDSFDNYFHMGRYHHIRGISLLQNSNYKNAEMESRQSLEINSKCGANVQSHYSLDCLSRIYMIKGDYKTVYEFIDKAGDIRKANKFMKAYNPTLALKLFIESMSSYEQSKGTYLKDFMPGKAKPNFKKYVLGSMEYINGVNMNERGLGMRKLEELTVNGSYPQIKKAAQKTLFSKKFESVR